MKENPPERERSDRTGRGKLNNTNNPESMNCNSRGSSLSGVVIRGRFIGLIDLVRNHKIGNKTQEIKPVMKSAEKERDKSQPARCLLRLFVRFRMHLERKEIYKKTLTFLISSRCLYNKTLNRFIISTTHTIHPPIT